MNAIQGRLSSIQSIMCMSASSAPCAMQPYKASCRGQHPDRKADEFQKGNELHGAAVASCF
jgi:hypothetical protein